MDEFSIWYVVAGAHVVSVKTRRTLEKLQIEKELNPYQESDYEFDEQKMDST